MDRDEGYKDFLRDRKCVACERTRANLARMGFSAANGYSVTSQSLTIDPAHGPVNGMGSKGPDSAAIPLCRAHHEEQHALGWPAFEAKYGIDREKEAAAHYALWLIQKEAMA